MIATVALDATVITFAAMITMFILVTRSTMLAAVMLDNTVTLISMVNTLIKTISNVTIKT